MINGSHLDSFQLERFRIDDNLYFSIRQFYRVLRVGHFIIYLFIHFFLKWFLGRFSHCFVYLLIYFFWHFFFVQVFWDRFWRFSETSPGSFQQFFDNFEQFIDSSWTVSVQFRIVCDVASRHLCFDVPRSKFGKLINRF